MTAVVHPDDVAPHVVEGAEVRTTFDASNGCDRLEQAVTVIPVGRVELQPLERGQAVLYVVSGRGTLELDGTPHELEPDAGVFIQAGERPTFDNPGPDDLVVVGVRTREATDGAPADRKVVVRFGEQPEEEASVERTFRYLINQDAGCADVTQFIGIVQPSKAPFHSHPYDEVGYVVEGTGVAHVDGEEIPLRAGSCFHLAPGQVHCIENSGPGAMRIMGVFHPSDSPASRNYPDNN
ncbi:MAG: cupin domain-containing protein [Actinobacteria bacterium]|nr:MAG: cupin domain-containing protein [Actinomycetota bacterium]